jgi:hypothetical protein
MEARLVDEVTWDGQASGAYGDGGGPVTRNLAR